MPTRLRNAWPALLGLLASACAAPEHCVIAPVTEVTAAISRDFALVPARLNGQNVRLMLDTGAGITMVSHALADRLALMPEDRLFPNAIEGIGGVTLSRRMVVDNFQVGGIDLGKQSVMVTAPGLFHGFDPPPDGIIGGDFLSHFDADIDLPRRRIGFYRAAACRTPFAPPWPGATIYRLPARITGGGQFLVTVTVDGVRLVALLDSGAEATAINRRAMAKLGLTPARLAGDPKREEIGIDMGRRAASLHHFATFKVGAETYRDPTIWVSDMPLLAADMLLGADFFQSHRVWLSFAQQTVFVAVAEGGGGQPPR